MVCLGRVVFRGFSLSLAILTALVVTVVVPDSSQAVPGKPKKATKQRGPMELRVAVARGLVTISATGTGSAKALDLRLTATRTLTVKISVGTYFRYAEEHEGCTGPECDWPQNLVVTRTTTVVLVPEVENSIAVPTACANRSRRIPSNGDRYVLGTAPAKLTQLFQCLKRGKSPKVFVQQLVWMVTDPNPSARAAKLLQVLSDPTLQQHDGCRHLEDPGERGRCYDEGDEEGRSARQNGLIKRIRDSLKIIQQCGITSKAETRKQQSVEH